MLGEFEYVLITTAAGLGQNAYGVAIRDEMEATIQRKCSMGALYTTMDRLEAKGLLQTWVGEATPQRGGRGKRMVRVTPQGVRAAKEDHVKLARLYWFTVEFGLINTAKGLKTYGAGIVSSYGETPYSLDSDKPIRKRFDPIDALRTPYRIDIFQSVYFIIDSLEDMFKLAHQDLFALIREAEKLGMHAPTFPPAEKKVSWA